MFLKDRSQFDKNCSDFIFFRSDSTGRKLTDSFVKRAGFHRPTSRRWRIAMTRLSRDTGTSVIFPQVLRGLSELWVGHETVRNLEFEPQDFRWLV